MNEKNTHSVQGEKGIDLHVSHAGSSSKQWCSCCQARCDPLPLISAVVLLTVHAGGARPWPLLLDLSTVELCNKSVRRPMWQVHISLRKEKTITSSWIESVICWISGWVYAEMVAVDMRTRPRMHMSMRDSPHWARRGPPCPEKQKEMTLEGVCCRSGAYDNARSVWVESGVLSTL